MNNNFLISVGIPVYNEEKNIQKLLNSLAKQQGVEIEKTIIVNDGSTDKTLTKINEISESTKKKLNIELINLDINEGKANALNIIFRHAQSDYLVLVDSDTYFPKEETIKRLLECFKADSNVGLVCGWYNVDVLKPFDIVGRAIRFSSNILEKVARVSNIYGAGGFMALPKKVYKNLMLPKNMIRDDAYVYLYVLWLGKKVTLCPNAKVIIPLYERETLKIFLRKQMRTRTIPNILKEKFKDLAEREFKNPGLWTLLKAFLQCFLINPLDGSIWVTLKAISYFYRKISQSQRLTYKWREAGF
jgi:glycosyltransferase involved in cell wall biosynthesis